MKTGIFLIEFTYGGKFGMVVTLLVYAETYKKAKQKIIDARLFGKPRYSNAREFVNLTIR